MSREISHPYGEAQALWVLGKALNGLGRVGRGRDCLERAHDLFGRLDMATPIDHFDDTLLHMHHPPSSKLNADGTLVTSEITPLSWKPTEPIGQLHRFAEPAGASAD